MDIIGEWRKKMKRKFNESGSDWEIQESKKIVLKNPILIEGMPGIGNVGKISMDFIIEEIHAKPFMTFFSKHLPNSVFVNENNLVELPRIELYHKKINGQDFLFLTGDAQPMTEGASYDFAELVIRLFEKWNGSYIVTLGGIGLSELPEHPKAYITGNDKKFVQQMISDLAKRKLKCESKIYGLVGPILGISGVLLGIAKKHDIKAFCLLAETLGHPLYVGLKGAKELLIIFNGLYGFKLNFKNLDKEIRQMDAQLQGLDKTDPKLMKYKKYSDMNYIG